MLYMYKHSPGLITNRIQINKADRRIRIVHVVLQGQKSRRTVKRLAASQHAQHQLLQDINNPDLDEVDLTQEDYIEQGLDTEVSQSEPDDLDPEGRPARLEDFYVPKEGIPQVLITELYSDHVYGPPAVVLAGFRAEEFAMVRAILDYAGGHDVKVIPCKEDMLFERMDVIIRLPEPDWASARPEGWTRGGSWGSQRTIMFSGMKLAAQAALVELLEEAGLPPVCAALAVADDADKQLGAVLAEAVQAQRSRRNPRQNVWEGMDHVARELPDIGDYLKSRAQVIQQDVEAGNLDRVTVRADGPDRTLTDVKDSLLHGRSDDGPSVEADEGSALGNASVAEDPSPAAASAAAEGTAAASSRVESAQQSAGRASRGVGLPDPSQARDGRPATDLEPPGPSTPAAASVLGSGPAGKRSAAPQPPADWQPARPVGRRPEQAPQRLELRDAVLSDPATPGAAAALLRGGSGAPGGGPGQQQAAELDRVRAEATAAGKSFMDGLAQNVGLAGDTDTDTGGSGACATWGGNAGQSGASEQQGGGYTAGSAASSVDSLIDDIAAGRALPPQAPPVASPEQLPSSRSRRPAEALETSSSGRMGTNGSATVQSGDNGGVRMVTSSQGKERVAQDIMEEVDKKIERMRQETDRDKVTTEMRSEAWEPTRDAIKAALACGLSAADLRTLVDEEAAAREADAEGWSAAWGAVPPLMPNAEEVAAARARGLAGGGGRRAGYNDILSPQPVPRSGAPGETVSAAGDVYLGPRPGGYKSASAAARAGSGEEEVPPGSQAGSRSWREEVVVRSSGSTNGGSFGGGSSDGASGGGSMLATGEAAGEGGGQGGNITKQQLRELAQRRGLDYEALLRDAAAQGVVLAEQ